MAFSPSATERKSKKIASKLVKTILIINVPMLCFPISTAQK
ncbi:hypothetical protein ADICYQ_4739 [Cyclobacterium qasimii M12-11B]|uniref:Uncharacterized protein n=1 Tax=Cyclobacterium qasimii M12-11B TaxID=641524 RepID=S7V9N3_9BACT|nr:hypothetical protein ADICYQ_4739 [Cyclobacterium qasimii M12-11B]